MAEDFNGPTIPANRRPNPALDFVVLGECQARARWAFKLGFVLGWLSASIVAVIAVIAVLP